MLTEDERVELLESAQKAMRAALKTCEAIRNDFENQDDQRAHNTAWRYLTNVVRFPVERTRRPARLRVTGGPRHV